MFTLFPNRRWARRLLLVAALSVTLVSLLYGAIFYWERHAPRLLSYKETAEGNLLILGESDGMREGWKMVLCYGKKGEPWAVYPLAREREIWRRVKVKTNPGHATITVEGRPYATLDLQTALLVKTSAPEKIAPSHWAPADNPFGEAVPPPPSPKSR